ncbi:biotin/lipoyl-binding protein, partial [Escherichia coli]|nr:biotin/lipoyl-binding protein [Escherichia coli]
CVAFSWGCKEQKSQKKQQLSDTVEVALPVRKDVEVWDSYTARIEGAQSVQIRARVSGYLEKIHFTDGDYVKQGDVLFQID